MRPFRAFVDVNAFFIAASLPVPRFASAFVVTNRIFAFAVCPRTSVLAPEALVDILADLAAAQSFSEDLVGAETLVAAALVVGRDVLAVAVGAVAEVGAQFAFVLVAAFLRGVRRGWIELESGVFVAVALVPAVGVHADFFVFQLEEQLFWTAIVTIY